MGVLKSNRINHFITFVLIFFTKLLQFPSKNFPLQTMHLLFNFIIYKVFQHTSRINMAFSSSIFLYGFLMNFYEKNLLNKCYTLTISHGSCDFFSPVF